MFDFRCGGRDKIVRAEPRAQAEPAAYTERASWRRMVSFQSVDISAYVVHTTLFKEPLDLVVERLLVIVGRKGGSIAVKF